MVKVVDPVRDALAKELRSFRKGRGEPTAERLTGLFYLTDILGNGLADRAFQELSLLRNDHGLDAVSDVGAFFYLAGWGVGLDSVDQRRTRYVEKFPCDPSTAWRRADRGIELLTALIRDRDEHARPWVMVSVFQEHQHFQAILDFNLGRESWQPPVITLNGQAVANEFVVHPHPDVEGRLTHRYVLEETRLMVAQGANESLATLEIGWQMPVWPVWQVYAQVADPRIVTRLRTYRERAVEVSLRRSARVPK